ncbi:hypothetical protein TRIUR3_24499 [Triticum urartu]|uniref:Uncharacterized protein n=1 Tax=Triticum urartu TaxID=4572 RepID=M7ZZE9_TRIUA|nr:hypothetical protein TRIUR3_24499 [Triticum urartu]
MARLASDGFRPAAIHSVGDRPLWNYRDRRAGDQMSGRENGGGPRSWTRQLRKLINMQDKVGRTALHYAIELCDPRLVAALLSHESIDLTILDNCGNSAASQLSSITIQDKTLDWKEVHVLMSKADPNDDDISLYNLRKGAKKQENIKSRRQRESMTQKYRSNTSLVAILLATITFTAAFTLPGGYGSDSGNAGLPTISGKVTFIVFLIFDTLAMCSSFLVAFICLMGKWEDDKFTTCYIFVTKKLTWFAYLATVTAFSTGLYPVLAPRLHWLAILICSLSLADENDSETEADEFSGELTVCVVVLALLRVGSDWGSS